MKKRIISAIIALAVVIPLFLIGGIPFSVGVSLVAVLGLKEIIDLNEKENSYPFYIKACSYLLLVFMVLGRTESPYIVYGLPFLSLTLCLLLLLIPTIFEKKYSTKEAFPLIGSIILLGTFFNLLIILFNGNKWILLYLILIATMTDTFAMVIGSLIGKHKLIPKVSPKKTVEGSLFGTIVAVIICTIYYTNVISKENLLLIILISIVLSILGQLGDLLFSKIKREHNIKDFSNIMPGHGGILDRLDSLTFIVLGYTIIINIMNMF